MKHKILPAICLAFIGMGALGAVTPAAAQTDTLVSKTPQNRAVLLEEYTGVKCSNCPDGHRIANQLAERHPGRFYAVNIHTSSYAEPYGAGEPDFRTPQGDELALNAGVNSLPSGVINRHVFQGNAQALSRPLWEGYTEACLELPAYANIAGRAAFDWQTRELSVEVQVFFTDSVPVEANFIHVALIQNDIIGSQKNAANNPAQNLGNNRYRHMHALRDFVTDLWGDEIAGAERGGFVSRTYTKRLPERIRNIELRPDDLSLIVFLTEDRDEVINVTEVSIAIKNGPGHLFAFGGGLQATHRSCDADVRVGFELENRTLDGEPIREIGFRIRPVGRLDGAGLGADGSKADAAGSGAEGETDGDGEAENEVFTVTVSDTFGYGDRMTVVSNPFALRRLDAADTVEISIGSVNGKPYGYEEQKTLRLPVAKTVVHTAEPAVEVHVWQDMFGSETQWTLHDRDGALLASGGPYEDLPSIGVKEHTATVTLQEGCHTFKIADAKGDGIHNLFGDGHFSLNTPDGTVLVDNDGRFGDSAFVFIKKSGVPNERTAADAIGLTLTPNPASDLLRIVCRHEIREVRVFSLTGQEMRPATSGLGTTDCRCDVTGFRPGIYLVKVATTDGTAIGKFVVR